MTQEMRRIFVIVKQNLFLSLLLWITRSQGQITQSQNSINTNSHTRSSSFVFFQQPEYPRDCQDVLDQCSSTNASGVYLIKPDGYPDAFEIYCDNTEDGGGWTVILRRTEESFDFRRTWTELKTGFGFLSNQIWLGLEKLSFLTNQGKNKIRINMENAAGSTFYIEYDLFRISDEWSNYALTTLGQYSGTADSVITYCPSNMNFGNCSCQATCEDPEILTGCQAPCNEEETCVCRGGFLKRGEYCVPPEECSCFVQGEGIVPNGEWHVNGNCTRRWACHVNVLTRDDTYACSSDATCEERDGVHQCYCNDGFKGDGQNCEVIATDCADIFNANITDSGVYKIKPTNWPKAPFDVYCNMTDGGGWTVLQRRVDGSQNFYLRWTSYEEGFGSPENELWLGNEKIFFITNQKSYQLRIDLVNRDGSPYYAKYDLFRINNATDNYRLVELGSHSGTAANSFNIKGKQFSTHDRDNDEWGGYDCAERHIGAWWYGEDYLYVSSHLCKTADNYCELWPEGNGCGECTDSNLNGDYDGTTRGSSIHWGDLPGYQCSIKYTEMKIKPV